uniref:Sushi domain-containing protein n=1 Tax=Terrapene triunguis TaxID=2587831 RepID=A0A674IM25_9SAUR
NQPPADTQCGKFQPKQCVTLLPPPYGSYYIEKGTGLSLGSVIVYWCREGYQLVGSEKLACLIRDRTSYWSHPAPHCEGKPLDKGFRVAVIASLISGVIILTMSVSFAACCLRDRLLRNRRLMGKAATAVASLTRAQLALISGLWARS